MNEKEIETEKQKYLKLFDEVFGTNTKKYIEISKVPLLSVIYDRVYEDITTKNPVFKSIRSKAIEKLDELEDTFTEEQQELFEKCWDLENQRQAKMEEQIFMMACIMMKELDREITDISED